MSTNEQTDFDFLVPYTRPLLRPDEAAKVLRFDRDTIYALAEAGKLEVHQGDASRSHIRVTRRSLVARLVSTAQYETDDMVNAVLGIAKTFTPHQRAVLRNRLQNL